MYTMRHCLLPSFLYICFACRASLFLPSCLHAVLSSGPGSRKTHPPTHLSSGDVVLLRQRVLGRREQEELRQGGFEGRNEAAHGRKLITHKWMGEQVSMWNWLASLCVPAVD